MMKTINRVIFSFFAAISLSAAVAPEVQAASSAGSGHSITIPQFLVLALVMGWYLRNHFKDKIKNLLKKNRNRSQGLK